MSFSAAKTMVSGVVVVLVMATAIASVSATAAGGVSDCAGSASDAKPIMEPSLAGFEKMRVPNGVRVNVPLTPTNTTVAFPSHFPLAVVDTSGGPYKTGVALGQLLADDAKAFVPNFIPDVAAEIEAALKDSRYEKYAKLLPSWFIDAFLVDGIHAALRVTVWMTKKYTPQRYLDEMQGFADGAGVEMNDLLLLNAFPELIKAACTIVIASGEATATGGVSQLRALDFGLDLVVWKYPVVVAYTGSNAEDHGTVDFVSVTFPGFLGSITGMNRNIGICEKAWFMDPAKNDSRFGQPFPFTIREVVEFFSTVEDGVQHVKDSRRTCSTFMGIGGRSTSSNNGLGGEILLTDHVNVTEYTDTNYHDVFPENQTKGTPEHLVRPGLVYVDKTLQPSHDNCTNALMDESYGQLDAAVLIQNVLPQARTGDLHAAVYEFAADGSTSTIFVGFPGTDDADGSGKPIPAYQRSFVRMDLDAIFGLLSNK